MVASEFDPEFEVGVGDVHKKGAASASARVLVEVCSEGVDLVVGRLGHYELMFRDDVTLLEDFVGEENIFDLLSIFDIDSGLNEMSGAGGGAVAGPAGPIGREDKDIYTNSTNESDIVRREYIDLCTIDDVMRLIMEKGIMR